jgi:hypothetical protein
LLQENLNGHGNVEAVQAAIVGEDVSEVDFRQVVDKAAHNNPPGPGRSRIAWRCPVNGGRMACQRRKYASPAAGKGRFA